MKQVLFALLISGVSACSPSENAIDPRDQYVGTYAVTAVFIYSVPGSTATTTESGTTTLMVEKGTRPNELRFMPPTSTCEGTLAGSTFIVPPYRQVITANAQTNTFDVSGNGSFAGKTISYTETAISSRSQVVRSFTGNRP